MDGVSRTALSVAAQRAVESERPGGLFVDPWARDLAGPLGFEVAEQIASASSMPHSAGQPSIFAFRTRFYDDQLVAAGTAGIRQVVLVAAGMDTRAFRLSWPDGTAVWEVDRGAVLAHKQAVLDAAGAIARCARCTVATDVQDALGRKLREAGLRPDRSTAWVAEGLLYYLDESQVGELLDEMASCSAPGSALITDVAPTLMRDLPVLQHWRDVLRRLGEPFRSFTDDGGALLRDHGWRVTDAVSIVDVAQQHGFEVPAVGSAASRRLLVARMG